MIQNQEGEMQEVQNQENAVERVFEYYPNMLPEIRRVIIDEMNPDDRCRFTRTSKLSNTEAKNSKRYLYGLQLLRPLENHVMVFVRFNDYVPHDRAPHGETMGFSLTFEEQNRKKLISCKTLPPNERFLWKIDLASDADLFQLATNTFQGYFQFFQNTIKLLVLPKNTNVDDYGIRSLNRLETIGISSHDQFLNVTSKMRLPLKSLLRYEPENNSLPENCEQLYEIPDSFQAHNLRMNYEQFLKFTAKKVCCHMGQITPNNVRDFIGKWQNGTIRENFRIAMWNFEPTEFDVQQLFSSLGEEFNNPERIVLRIKHNSEAGRFAAFHYIRSGREYDLIFDARRQQ